jgi:hypothetical protein
MLNSILNNEPCEYTPRKSREGTSVFYDQTCFDEKNFIMYKIIHGGVHLDYTDRVIDNVWNVIHRAQNEIDHQSRIVIVFTVSSKDSSNSTWIRMGQSSNVTLPFEIIDSVNIEMGNWSGIDSDIYVVRDNTTLSEYCVNITKSPHSHMLN